MTACGIWRAGPRLIAVFVDDDGRPAPSIRAATDDDARWTLLERVDAAHGLDWTLVLPDELLHLDSIGRLALARGHELWAAPQRLVDAIRAAAGLGRPASVAALLGRLLVVPGFRSHLRRVEPLPQDWRQLRLL
jgi:hypothetical protein